MIIAELYCERCGNGDFTKITRYTKPEEEIIYKCNKCGKCYKVAGGDYWKVEC